MLFGRLAQLVEHPLDVREVTGSSPVSSTKERHEKPRVFLFLRFGRFVGANCVRLSDAAEIAASGGRSQTAPTFRVLDFFRRAGSPDPAVNLSEPSATAGWGHPALQHGCGQINNHFFTSSYTNILRRGAYGWQFSGSSGTLRTPFPTDSLKSLAPIPNHC